MPGSVSWRGVGQRMGCRSAGGVSEAEHRVVERERVQLAPGADSERGQLRDVQAEIALLAHAATLKADGPDPARAVVTVQVGAAQPRHLAAAVDGPADHGARAALVAVLDERVDRADWAVAREAVGALAPVPAVVAAAGAGRFVVDLFPVVLADVANPQVAGCRIEREPPGVTQPVVPDLRPGARVAGE